MDDQSKAMEKSQMETLIYEFDFDQDKQLTTDGEFRFLVEPQKYPTDRSGSRSPERHNLYTSQENVPKSDERSKEELSTLIVEAYNMVEVKNLKVREIFEIVD
jgi:hypothetical protein